VAVDLSHIATPAKVAGYLPADGGLEKALTGANVIVIPAGIPRKPGVSSRSYQSNQTISYDFTDDSVCIVVRAAVIITDIYGAMQ
jgi:malate/lactate dehydrogenase